MIFRSFHYTIIILHAAPLKMRINYLARINRHKILPELVTGEQSGEHAGELGGEQSTSICDESGDPGQLRGLTGLPRGYAGL